MPPRVVETLIGALVVTVAALLIVFVYRSTGISVVEGYTVTAMFDRVEGIRVGSEVRLSGIKVGSVVAEKLEPDTYFAVLTLSIDNSVRLPADTAAKIVTEGLVGNKYVALQPGAEENLLEPGGQITHTQSSINLEDLISRYLFGGAGKRGDAHGAKSPKAAR